MKATNENKSTAIKICTEMIWPDPSQAFHAAIEENRDNLLMHDLPTMDIPSDKPQIAFVFSKLWKPERTLRIAFLGKPNSIVKEKIKTHAVKWLDYIDLKFEFTNGKTGDIRISTDPGGSWSYLGTDAKLIPKNQPTMNYGWLFPDTHEDEYNRVVLHEFGHALGAIHEHMHPEAGIPWDKPAVYKYYARTNGWSEADVDHNIFKKYERNQLNMNAYDPLSIMHYAVPNELTIGNYEIGWNNTLSENDKEFARINYSKNQIQ